MEDPAAQIPDSPSKNSYIGSYYQPPGAHLDLPARSVPEQMPGPLTHVNNAAVVNALRNLQQKINQMELEKKEAKINYQQFSQDVSDHKEGSSSPAMPHRPGPHGSGRKEYHSKLQSVEARCKILERQLGRLSKMVEHGDKERTAVAEPQDQQPSSSDARAQQEKLEKIETECLKLSRTQALAETKLAVLEEKLLREERERLLVQEKADQLQKELDTNLHASPRIPTEKRAARTKPARTTPPRRQGPLPSGPNPKKMPFVAGKSTSPSHSVHANVQGILHMMKHHQPWLCEQNSREPKQADRSLGLLSDLLLALQDELGQMSFEHQGLVEEINERSHRREDGEDLKLELERSAARMEEKGAQITKLRKHWKTFQNLTQGQRGAEGPVSRNNAIRPPVPSPLNVRRKGKSSGPVQNNLQLLRETHRFRSNLKRDDISWET